MARPTKFGEAFSAAYLKGFDTYTRAQLARDAEREEAKKLKKRTARAQHDTLMGKLRGASPEAIRRLMAERNMAPADDPLAAIRESIEGNRRQKGRIAAGYGEQLDRIQAGITAEDTESRRRLGVEHGADVQMGNWMDQQKFLKDAVAGETAAQKVENYLVAAAQAGIPFDQVTLGGDIEPTESLRHLYETSRLNKETLEGKEFAKKRDSALAAFMFRQGEAGRPLPQLAVDNPEQYPLAEMQWVAGRNAKKIKDLATDRGVRAAGEIAEGAALRIEEAWLKSPEVANMTAQLAEMWKRPKPTPGMVAVPFRKAWDKTLSEFLSTGYAKKDKAGAIVPTEKYLKMYKNDPKKFALYTRYTELTGKFPAAGATESKLKSELDDIASETLIQVSGITINALKAGGGLNKVAEEVDRLIAAGGLPANRRKAVLNMAMKGVREAQYASAVGEGAQRTAYSNLSRTASPGMKSEVEIGNEPRWIIVMKQDTDDDGNPVLVGTYYKHPDAQLTKEELKAINIKLNDVGAVGRSGVPKRVVLPSGKEVIIQRKNEPLVDE